MDVVEEQIAQVYAEAFLGVANQTDRAAGLVEELVSLVEDVLEQFPALEEALGSLLVGHVEKETLLDRVFGNKAAPEVLNFLKVLSAHGRLEILRTVVRSVESQYSKQIGKVEVEKAFNRTFSEEYNIHRTRQNFPNGIDNFTNMANIGVFITDRVLQNELGGGIDLKNNIWYIPSKN